MAGLVAVSILSHQSGDVELSLLVEVAVSHKQSVELLHERLLAAQQLNQSVHIVWSEPQILPCVALGVVACLVVGVEALHRQELALAVL